MRRVLEAECPLSLVRDVVERGAGAEAPWKSATELGWTGIPVPSASEASGSASKSWGSWWRSTAARWLGAVAEGRLGGALAVANGQGAGLSPDRCLVARPEAGAWRLEGERHFVLVERAKTGEALFGSAREHRARIADLLL